jgi:hypothetical protein
VAFPPKCSLIDLKRSPSPKKGNATSQRLRKITYVMVMGAVESTEKRVVNLTLCPRNRCSSVFEHREVAQRISAKCAELQQVAAHAGVDPPTQLLRLVILEAQSPRSTFDQATTVLTDP